MFSKRMLFSIRIVKNTHVILSGVFTYTFNVSKRESGAKRRLAMKPEGDAGAIADIQARSFGNGLLLAMRHIRAYAEEPKS